MPYIKRNLEKIVQELEKGDLNLDESIKKFEEGMNLSKKCNEILEEAEKILSRFSQDPAKSVKPPC